MISVSGPQFRSFQFQTGRVAPLTLALPVPLSQTAHVKHHTSHVHFSQCLTCTRMAQVWVRPHSISCFMCHLVCLSDCSLFDDSTLLSLLTIFSLITLSFLLPVNFIFQGCGGQIPCGLPPVRTLAPLPNTTLSTTTTSRRLLNRTSRNPPARTGSPNDFDYDDVTIGKALSDACRGRADHFSRRRFVVLSVVVRQS